MIINVYKPAGWTSFAVVKKVRYITGEKKVGHGGTLDPFAEGVLILGTGRDTRRLTEITATDKEYRAVLQLGAATTTLDPEGEVTEERPVPELSADQITEVLDSFIGAQQQVPPMYSAKKINGQRLYKLARKNIIVERKPADININSIRLDSWGKDRIEFTVSCSKGTYIRVLGADIAQRLGTAGHLIKLVRTAVGEYSVDSALTIEEITEKWKSSAA